jgi:2-oxoglutarate/2-oxoacid ferredoxin oxidoreductase subunit beta
MLSRIFWPEFPVPVGVIRDVRLPTHDELMTAQIDAALAQRGPGDIRRLLTGGETWSVE